MQDLLTVAKDYGPAAAIIVFFIWRDYRREQSMTATIEDITAYQRDKLEKMVEDSIGVFKDVTSILRDVCEALKNRPCIAKEMDKINDGLPK